MQSIRAFIACELSPDTKQSLKIILAELQKKSDPRFRWIPLENIHLTLKFIGNIELNKLDQLKTTLASVVAAIPGIAFDLEKFGVFPNLDHPRLLWLGVKAPVALTELVDIIEEKTAIYGIPHEARPFSPHLTLCRIQQDTDKSLMRDFINSFSPSLLSFSFQNYLNYITIFKSDLTPSGAVYTPIARFGLQKNPSSV